MPNIIKQCCDVFSAWSQQHLIVNIKLHDNFVKLTPNRQYNGSQKQDFIIPTKKRLRTDERQSNLDLQAAAREKIHIRGPKWGKVKRKSN